ncbi:hypothetical protein GCM10018790_81800 [Kitasatospora xanthocidica]|uniref:hypothetical protein n=1 Tax=Kitasatospora xanthocidica TaxID=83382 RepID=UPI0016766194|nr:hypothetical protein [Kitasatospora xanthocidica]GHF92461.1 hypothetical protein GCM10018790_81800 [Kitasatospora xanthocidica]
MNGRKKLSALALTAGLLLGGVAVATPASAADYYCGPTTQVVPGGSVYAQACISTAPGATAFYYAFAYVTSNGNNTFTRSDVFINSGGTYYGKGTDCGFPSTPFSNRRCNGPLVTYTYNGYVQGQIELWVDGGYYKAFSPSVYVG